LTPSIATPQISLELAQMSACRAGRYNGKRLGWRRLSTAVTLGVTPRSAEGSGLHGLRAIRPKTWVPHGHSDAKSRAPESREFWPDFRRGGMAEWSMAVVLKTDFADPQNSRFSA